MEAYVYRGFIFFYNGDDAEAAIADYEAAIAIDPGNPLPYHYRGIVNIVREDTDKAIASFSKAIELDPEFSLSYLARANAYITLGEEDKAIEDWLTVYRITEDEELRQQIREYLQEYDIDPDAG